MGVEWLWFVDYERGEFLVEFFEECFRKSGADVADCLVLLRCWVVGSEEEGTVDGGAFSAAVVCP